MGSVGANPPRQRKQKNYELEKMKRKMKDTFFFFLSSILKPWTIQRKNLSTIQSQEEQCWTLIMLL
jgi:hypothetical protein